MKIRLPQWIHLSLEELLTAYHYHGTGKHVASFADASQIPPFIQRPRSGPAPQLSQMRQGQLAEPPSRQQVEEIQEKIDKKIHRLRLELASCFWEMIKLEFVDHLSIYNEFQDILNNLKTERSKKKRVMRRVLKLFSAHRNLLPAFNYFLPASHRFEMESCTLNIIRTELKSVPTSSADAETTATVRPSAFPPVKWQPRKNMARNKVKCLLRNLGLPRERIAIKATETCFKKTMRVNPGFFVTFQFMGNEKAEDSTRYPNSLNYRLLTAINEARQGREPEAISETSVLGLIVAGFEDILKEARKWADGDFDRKIKEIEDALFEERDAGGDRVVAEVEAQDAFGWGEFFGGHLLQSREEGSARTNLQFYFNPRKRKRERRYWRQTDGGHW